MRKSAGVDVKRIFPLVITVLFLFSALPYGTGQDMMVTEEDIPLGFRTILLGMAPEEVKAELRGDPLFRFRGEPDVSLLRRPNESIIDTAGVTYIERALFQFHSERLHTITLILDPYRMDHYTMFTTFSRKYGPPKDLDPSRSLWDFGPVLLSLERPLRVKYMDRAILDEIRAAGITEESLEEIARSRFLGSF